MRMNVRVAAPMMTAWRIEFLRFLVIGGITAAVYAGTLYALVTAAGLHPGFGAGGAYLAAMAVNYTGHYFWTYRTDLSHRSAIRRYLIANAILFVLNALVMAVGPAVIEVHYAVVQAVAVALIAAATFVLQRQWVFSARP
jgi:putative flippase GtrA